MVLLVEKSTDNSRLIYCYVQHYYCTESEILIGRVSRWSGIKIITDKPNIKTNEIFGRVLTVRESRQQPGREPTVEPDIQQQRPPVSCLHIIIGEKEKKGR